MLPPEVPWGCPLGTACALTRRGIGPRQTTLCPLVRRIRGLAREVWRRALQVGLPGPVAPVWTPLGRPGLSSYVLPLQVVEETQAILREYGFRFVRRGTIFVKGKGELLTFFLKGRDKPAAFPNGSSVTLPHQVVDNS